MIFVDSLIRSILKSRLPKIQYFMRNPHDVQAQTLEKLLRTAKDTVWGKKYDYATIKTLPTYQERVPISAYEDITPYIDRMMQGEQNILWHTPIHWFSKSSGTTNARSKFIPVSKEALRSCHFRVGRDMLALYLHNNPKSKFFWGRGLSIGGTYQRYQDKQDIFVGDVSAVIVKNLPKWAQNLRTPPLHIAMMDKWEEKIEAMARHTVNQNITSMLGVPTWTVVLLQRLLEMTGKTHIEEVWKGLEVFIHGAVAFTPYRSLFQKIAPTLRYMEIYNASEGAFGLQDDLTRDDMLLMLDYDVFYEFVPVAELEAENPTVYPIWDIELEKNYAMLISTSGGLWRYKIGDTVKFTSKDPYRIKITGRTKHFINAFGEEVIVENAEEALTYACTETDAMISNYTAGPLYMADKQQGGHEWIIEFEKDPQDMTRFIELLDKKLKEVNSDYDAKRYQDIALKMPLVHKAPSGTFYNWLKKKGKLGGQYKVPRLANSREYLDDILKLFKSNRTELGNS